MVTCGLCGKPPAEGYVLCRACIARTRMLVTDVPVWFVALHGLLEPRTAAIGALEGLGGTPSAPLREEASSAVMDIKVTIRRVDREVREQLGRTRDAGTASHLTLTARLGQRGRSSQGGAAVAWAVITLGRLWDEYTQLPESVATSRQLLALRERVIPVLGWERELRVHSLPVSCPACTHYSLMLYTLDNLVHCTTCSTEWSEQTYRREAQLDDAR